MKALGLGCAVMIGLVVLFVVLSVLGFGGRWFNKAAEVAGPQNVEHQFAKAYQLYEGMPSLQANIEAQQAEVNRVEQNYGDRPWPEDVRKRYARAESRMTSYITQYNRLARQYNAQMSDVFQGRVVGPPDLPDRVDMYDLP